MSIVTDCARFRNHYSVLSGFVWPFLTNTLQSDCPVIPQCNNKLSYFTHKNFAPQNNINDATQLDIFVSSEEQISIIFTFFIFLYFLYILSFLYNLIYFNILTFCQNSISTLSSTQSQINLTKLSLTLPPPTTQTQLPSHGASDRHSM